VVNKDVPARTLKELIDFAKANPGKLNYASSGVGTVQHIGTELLALRTQTRMTHVPYRGAGAAMTDLLSGQVSLLITTPPAVVSHIRSGAVRALAIASKTRHPMLPDVPTTSEAGVKDVELDAWFGVYAPTGTPPAIVKRLAAEMETLVTSADFKRRAEDAGTYATYLDPAKFDAFTRSELVYWSDVIKTVGIKVE
jgi:tripartite-type tricarboxylate transporter receptor subunit TctC